MMSNEEKNSGFMIRWHAVYVCKIVVTRVLNNFVSTVRSTKMLPRHITIVI